MYSAMSFQTDPARPSRVLKQRGEKCVLDVIELRGFRVASAVTPVWACIGVVGITAPSRRRPR